MKKTKLLTTTFLLFTSINFAYANPIPGIPTKGEACDHKRCNHSNGSEVEQKACLNKLYEEQDVILNKNNKKIISLLKSKQKKLFIKSQNTWDNLKKDNNGFAISYYHYSGDISLSQCFLTKHRNQDFYEILKGK